MRAKSNSGEAASKRLKIYDQTISLTESNRQMSFLRFKILKFSVGRKLPESILSGPPFGGSDERAANSLSPRIVIDKPAFEIGNRACRTSICQRSGTHFGKTSQAAAAWARRNQNDSISPRQPSGHLIPMRFRA